VPMFSTMCADVALLGISPDFAGKYRLQSLQSAVNKVKSIRILNSIQYGFIRFW
jgi:hypothetical protein